MKQMMLVIALLLSSMPVNAEENTIEIGSEFINISGDLTLGSKGTDVVYLQTFLEEKGYLTMPLGVAKGYFGSLTQSALVAWQKSMKVDKSEWGYLGPESRAKIFLKTPIYRSEEPGPLIVVEFDCDAKTKPIIFKDISSNRCTMTLKVLHGEKKITAHYYEHKSTGKEFLFSPAYLSVISEKFDLSVVSDNKILLQGYWSEPDKVFYFTEFIFQAEEIFPKQKKKKLLPLPSSLPRLA